MLIAQNLLGVLLSDIAGYVPAPLLSSCAVDAEIRHKDDMKFVRVAVYAREVNAKGNGNIYEDFNDV